MVSALPFKRRNHFHPLTFVAFAQGGMLTHRDAFTHECFYTEMLLAKARFCTQTWCFYTQMPLCTGAFTQARGAFTHRCAGISTHRCLYTAMLLHRNAFTHQYICFYTGILLTQSSLYTQKLLHKYSYAEMVPTVLRGVFLLTDTFSKRCFCTGLFYREMLLHTGAFRLGHF